MINSTKLLNFLFVKLILIINVMTNVSMASEPIVVLEYSSSKTSSIDLKSNNKFVSNPEFSLKHKVQENETLGHIMYAYYGGSGLNLRIVEMAIVEFNPKSFRNRNPNYLFANKTLYLPSLNEIKNLVLGRKNTSNQKSNSKNSSSHIFFFGG